MVCLSVWRVGLGGRVGIANDKNSFRQMFSQSIVQKKDLLTYARLRCQPEYYGAAEYGVPQKEVLFEITGYPHSIPGEEECKCFFAVAKPYPSRNTAMYVSTSFVCSIPLSCRNFAYAEIALGGRTG